MLGEKKPVYKRVKVILFAIINTFLFSSFVFCSQTTYLVNVTKYNNKGGYKGQDVKYAIFDRDGFAGGCNLKDQGVKFISDGYVYESYTGWTNGTSMLQLFTR
jgi:hypothetical protein